MPSGSSNIPETRRLPNAAGAAERAGDVGAPSATRAPARQLQDLPKDELLALARLRGAEASESDDVPALVKKLKKQEGFFTRMNRKRRSVVASLAASIVGAEPASEYQFLPPQGQDSAGTARPSTLKEEIEE